MSRISFSRNTVIYLLGGVVAAGGNVLLAPLYLRLLSAQDYGLWSRFVLMQQLAQVVMGWGLMAAVSRLLAEADAPPRQAALVGTAVKLATLLNGGLLLLALLLGSLPSAALWPGAAGDLRLASPALLAAALSVYPAILLGKLVADGAALRHRSLSLIGFALQVLTLLAVAARGQVDAQGAVLALLAALSGYAAFALLGLARAGRGRAGHSEACALLAFGLPVVLYTGAGQATDLALRYVLSRQGDTAEFGAFSATLVYASVIAMVCSAVNLAWTPLFYRRAQVWYADGTYRGFVDLFVAAMATVAVLMTVFAPELLALYSGGRMVVSPTTVGLLATSAWLNSAVWMSMSNPLFERKRTRAVLSMALGAALLSIPPGLVLIGRFGSTGAALALALNALLLCLLAAAVARRSALPGPSAPTLVAGLTALLLASAPLLHQSLIGLSDGPRLLCKLLGVALAGTLLAAIALRSGLTAFKTIESSHSL